MVMVISSHQKESTAFFSNEDFNASGVGDSGDHWRVICDSDFWERDDSVTFKHVDTSAYLASSGENLLSLLFHSF